eukprot:3137160-Amphidinium_carterae.5
MSSFPFHGIQIVFSRLMRTSILMDIAFRPTTWDSPDMRLCHWSTKAMVEEEYWNHMIGVWKRRNAARREQAQMVADMMGMPLEIGEFSAMPFYKKVPKYYRVRRFQLGKLKLMMRDRAEEMEAIRRRALEEEDAIADELR